MKSATEIVDEMMANDKMSQWLGIEILKIEPGYSKIRMTVREEMCNGFGITHGGITYCLSDSALAFACNGPGMKAMSIETSISHISSVFPNDVLTAEATELSRKNRVAVYNVKVWNQNDEMVSDFKGTVYRSSKEW